MSEDPQKNTQQQQGAMTTSSSQSSGDTATTTTNTSSNAAGASASQQNQQQPAGEQPKKAKRKRITPEQLEDLVGLFEKTDTPSFEIRESLAKKLGMTNREIQVWHHPNWSQFIRRTLILEG